MASLPLPFDPSTFTSNDENGVSHPLDFSPLLPAAAFGDHHGWEDFQVPVPDEGFLYRELSVDKLNYLHEQLSYITAPLPPQPLHRQRLRGRDFFVTEDVEYHLIYYKTKAHVIHIKPMPRYLLDVNFWRDHLTSPGSGSEDKVHHSCDVNCSEACKRRRKLYGLALGFMFSYVALVHSESDFHIAQQYHLIPSSVEWHHWVSFVRQLLSNDLKSKINKRYHFGEVSLLGLNALCILNGWGFRAYNYSSRDYSNWIRRNVEGIFALFALLAIILSAMQVGLGTNHLQNSPAFQSATFGFTVTSIILPLAVTLGYIFIEGLLMLLRVFIRQYHWKRTGSKLPYLD
jgi:hypothetical protein